MDIPLRVLVLEDDANDAELVMRELGRTGYKTQWHRVDNRTDFQRYLANGWDIVLADYKVPGFSVEEALQMLSGLNLDIPLIVMSGAVEEEVIVQLMKKGASDYLLKDRLARLGTAISHALEEKRLRAETQRALLALKENEQRYRSLCIAMSETVWIATPQGETIQSSATWRKTTGQTVLESQGMGWINAVHPQDRENAMRRWKDSLETGKIYESEYRVRMADGTYNYFSSRGVPVLNENGTVREWVGTSTNITQHKESEERMRVFSHLGRQLSTAIRPEEAAQVIISIADDLFGWDACTLDLYKAETNTIHPIVNVDTIEGKKTHISPKAPCFAPTARMQQVIQNGRTLILRKPSEEPLHDLMYGDVTRHSMSIMAVPIRHGMNVIGILTIQSYAQNAYSPENLNTLQALADYCGGALERIRAEEQLSYQAHLLANINDAILGTDHEFTLTAWNRAAEEMYGWKSSEVIGKKLSEIIRVEGGESHYLKMMAALAVENRFCAEIKHFRRDGRPVFVESTAVALRNESAGVTGYAITHHNIDSRRHLEEQLRQSQKMEAFGQLAGGVAHDFNNILTVISGYTNLVLSKPNVDSETREDLGLILAAAEKAGNLTRQLLTFSRKKGMQLAPVKLNEVVSSVSKMLHRVIGEDIRLQCSFSDDIPLIEADPAMLDQVILNLAVNARDAMPKGGELFIQIEPVKIPATYANPEARPGDYVCLTVRDTGSGIPPEIRERIFEPFFTTKSSGKGTGLGLATVYGIVKQHRGWIEVHSAMGSGTTFKIFLPAGVSVSQQPLPDARIPALNGHSHGGHETILLVEDEPGVRVLARQILQRHGYRVIEAESGAKALSLVKQNGFDFDLLLTDMVMPEGVNGRELAEKLQSQRVGLKVIYTSGYSVNLNELELREGWNFLQKQYQRKKMVSG